MTTPSVSRTRSTSEGRQDGPLQRQPRPPMQSRTYSAPAGKLHLSDRSGNQDVAGFEAISENEALQPDKPVSTECPDKPAVSSPRLPQVNLAVIGANGVGKSTFVKCALDLKQTPLVRSSLKKMSLDGTIYVVRLLEITVDRITFDDQGQIVWPKYLGDQALPPIDGVLALFDSSDLQTVSQFPRVFDSLRNSSNIPFIVVACKCDDSHRDSQHDSAIFEKACQILSGIKIHRVSYNVPDSNKRCISAILRSIILRTYDVAPEEQRPRSARNRSATSSNIQTRQVRSHNHQHTRAASEQPRPASGDTTLSDRSDGVSNDSANNSKLANSAQDARHAWSNPHPVPPRTPPGNRLNRGTSSTGETGDSSPSSNPIYRRLRTTWRQSAGSDAFNSFLDMEDETDDSKPTGSPSSSNVSKEKGEYAGATLDELVDRLISLPLSKQDAKFTPIFLCLYRKFATPAQLLFAIVSRFDQIADSQLPQLTRHADQLRLLNVLSQWVAEYPGDFVGTKTRKRLTEFISLLEKHMIFTFAAKEMTSFIDKFVEDDDMCWAFNNENTGPENVETFLDTYIPSSPATFIAQDIDEPITSLNALGLSDENLDLSSQYSNMSTTSSIDRTGSISSQSFKTLLTVESAQREAQRLEILPRGLLTKTQWHMFMEIGDEEFAREVTRMDWIMYSSFRPRELIRHVSVSTSEKDKPSSNLENVNRMIKAFNHLAFFVASMILLRDKPKHRAEALEKFMNISLKLRQLNNYNSLGAVIAGLNGTPVSRLSQTRDLVSPSVQKQFMSLIILMGTQKSHFAYRLAWDNSFNERIPFLPLHLRDLVSAEEGNKTFVGGNPERINWRKFEVMGEVVLGIQKSQKTPFPVYNRHDTVQRLLLDTKLGDEEELYSRSLHLESAAGGPGADRKLFGWRRP